MLRFEYKNHWTIKIIESNVWLASITQNRSWKPTPHAVKTKYAQFDNFVQSTGGTISCDYDKLSNDNLLIMISMWQADLI